MKLLNILLVFALTLGFRIATLSAQNVNIPDANFKAYLLGNTVINANGDSEIQITEAANYTSNISCSNRNISDLTGIEAFTYVHSLYCGLNNLTSLDLSQNIGLVELICAQNNLTSLNLPTSGNLLEVNCGFNQITSLDLSQVYLSVLQAESNNLYSLDIRNGQNNYIYNAGFNTTNNPNLSCISVDDVAYSTANWTNIDAGTSFSTSCSIPAPMVNIPDANFKAYLVGDTAINTNGDAEIQVSEAAAFAGTINCSNLSIVNLTGIEAFLALTALDCSSNSLTDLELTLNTSLISLDCSSNNLSSLEVKNNNNINFTSFDATNNSGLSCIEVDDAAYSTTNWTSIDAGTTFSTNCVPPVVNIPDANFKTNLLNNTAINTNGDGEIQVTEATAFTGTINCSSANLVNIIGIEAFVNLTGLVCTYNQQLLSLNVSQNVNLLTLNCSNNYQLGSVSANNNLQTLTCTNTNLYGLSLNNITGLVTLNCSSNSIMGLDVSQNTNLVNLNCTATDITSLDLSNNPNLEVFQCDFNQLSNLNVRNGNNTIITTFQVNYGSLRCVDVDDVAYSTANWTNVDPGTTYSLNCNAPPVVNIPDANFKAYLVGNTSINTNYDTEIQVSEAIAFAGRIDCSSLSIADLTGIEAFVNLDELNCGDNNLTTLNVTRNTRLTDLYCNNNQLSSLDVTRNTRLVWFGCTDNLLSVIDMTQNTNVIGFYCTNNSIYDLDLSQNTALRRLSCNNNQMGNLNVKNGNNTNVTSFIATGNSLTCIEVDDVAYSTANWMDIDSIASFNTNCITATPTVNIPDANFKAYLVGNTAINTNGDTEIQVTEATAFTGVINCPNLNIADVTGVEAFVNLTQLKCFNNQISSLDVSQNTNLIVLHCVNNSISSLDVSQNTSLSWLYCSTNQIGSLDLTQNTSLTKLYCSSNQLISLNVKNGNNTMIAAFNATNNANLSCIEVDNPTYSTTNWTQIDAIASFNTACIIAAPIVTIPDANFKANLVGNTAINTNGDAEIQVTEATAFSGTINCSSLSIADLTGVEAFVNLTGLDCSSNNLSSLDVTQNTSLTSLDCSSNNLSNLDVTQNTSLTSLDCSSNNLSSLDVTLNTNLTALVCHTNNLSSLVVKNSNNTNFTIFDATNNSNLTCIEVDNATYAIANWTNIDATASFNNDCNAQNVYIPDANFKAYLVGNTAINTSGDADIQVSEAVAFSGIINCPSLNITDLTGIEAFVNLTQLKCYNNQLSSLNLSQNTNLVVLHCVNNSITSLDVTSNTSLSWLYCSTNQLSSLDLTQNTSLAKLYCNSNQIASLDLSQNENLVVCNASSNALSSLDAKNGQNTSITTFKATGNPNLTCIQVDDAAYSTANWTNIDATASFNNICVVAAPVVHIPDANFKAYLVGDAIINRNGDAEIQVSEAVLFAGTINCPNLGIADLTGIEAFVNLTQLKCYRNNLTSLDVTQNTSLTVLHCVNNLIASLDVTRNTSLVQLFCSNNPITSLDVTQNTNLTKLYCNTTQLTTLDVRQNTSLTVLNCSSAQLSNLNVKNGNNTNFTTFKAINNANLTCIEVDDAAYSTANWTNIDAGVSFSTSCTFIAPTVTIPDANFKAYLVGNTAINTDGDTEIQVSEATAFNGSISCANLSIVDLTGIEAFENLTTLDCSFNSLTSLDLNQHTSLTALDCQANNLTSLQVQNGNNTNFTAFNALNNPNLSCIGVDNAIYSIANWTSIDVTTSFSVACGAPIVTIPDANFKAYLVGSSSINTNGDTEIQVSEATDFSGIINCSNSSIVDLTGVEAFVNLTQLKCYGNQLTSLDVSQNTSLVVLHCVNNSLTSLDVTANTSLSWLYCSGNQLSSLDLSQNTSLTKLYCGSNQLGSLNVKNGNNTIITAFNTTNNANLTCIDVDDVAYSTVTWTDIDAGVATFSTNCAVPRVVQHSDINAPMDLVKNTAINLNSLEALDSPINLSVYPNPATREITLDFGKTYENVTLQITNLTGQIIKHETMQNSAAASLELEGAAGVYFVRIQTEAGSATLKVIKE